MQEANQITKFTIKRVISKMGFNFNQVDIYQADLEGAPPRYFNAAILHQGA